MSGRKYLNNFHAKFPGGYCRREFHEGLLEGRTAEVSFSERTEKMFTELDATLQKTGFDIKRFERERAAWHQAIKTMKNQPIDSRAFEVLGKLADARKERVHDLIYPVYEEMLRRGYTHEELTT